MTSLWKHVTQRLSLSVVSLLLIVLLTACGSLGGAASAPTPTPTPTATPTPTPSPTPAVTTYTGDGYTISYPQDWKQSSASGQVSFQDALGANALAVVAVANPGGAAKPSTVLDTSLASAVKGANLTNTVSANLPGTVSLAGETWLQKGTTGTVSGTNTSVEVVVLATNHPANAANTKLFAFIYAGPLAGSTLADEQIFQAMLASFKFTS